MQQLRLFPRDPRLPVVLVDGAGNEWNAVRRRLRRSRADIEVQGRQELTNAMEWPGATARRVAALVVVIGDGVHEIPDLLEVIALAGDVPVVVVDVGQGAATRRALSAGAEEVVPFKDASIERLEQAVVSAVYRRGAEYATRAASDDLTGLATRAVLEKDLATLLEVPGESGVAVLFCDLDRFKAINDELGHAIGDQVLRAAASRLRNAVRASDLLARIGGDEFVVVMRCRGGRTVESAEHVAGRIVESFREPFRSNDLVLNVSVSVGLATHRAGESGAELLERADSALYVAKKRGKSRVACYDDGLDRAAASRRTAVELLSEGLRRDTLDAEVAPMIDPAAARVVGHVYRASWGRTSEVLRTEAPARPPSVVAADGGGGTALFRWLLGHIAEDETDRADTAVPMRRWLTMPPAVLLGEPSRYLEASARRGVHSDRLVVVMDESDLDEGLAVRNALLDVARTGARVAVGHFGAGSAALSLLERHPFEAVWVDRQMVDGVSSDSIRRAKLGAVAAVAASLGQQIVIDRPSRREDELAALDVSAAMVIDGSVDLAAIAGRPLPQIPGLADRDLVGDS